MTRGEVWLALLDPVRGSEQAGTRPVLILQSDALNVFLRTVVVLPFTTNPRWASFPFCVAVPAGEGGLVSDSVVLCHQIRVVDKSRLSRRLGQVAGSTMTRVDHALRFAVGT
jgi:mRNA interferase MazF